MEFSQCICKVDWLLLPILTKIFRASLALSFIPNIWRMARVIFIPKTGRDSYDQAKAFRPICLSSFLLKILEKIMDRHIRDVLESNAPLHKNHFAYQPGKSTDTALHQLVTRIEKTLDTKGIALGAFLDIEGAFDNTSYLSIIRSAQRKGINDTLCRWIDATLNGRRMMTTLFEETVEVLVGGGCPQGGGSTPPSFGNLSSTDS
jgi:hypothetical protein